MGSKLHITCGDHPDEAFWTKSGHFGPSDDLSRGQKIQIQDYLGPKKGFICSYNGLLGAPMGAQKVWKWVGDACPVDMGQLDHCVVLGTKSGAVQDFQRGKKSPIGVKQTPLDPPKHPQAHIIIKCRLSY